MADRQNAIERERRGIRKASRADFPWRKRKRSQDESRAERSEFPFIEEILSGRGEAHHVGMGTGAERRLGHDGY